MDLQYENPEKLTREGSSGSLHLAEHGAHWCLPYATCADPRELNTVEEWAWGITLGKKLWTNGDVFQRVGYFIGSRDCLPWFTRAGWRREQLQYCKRCLLQVTLIAQISSTDIAKSWLKRD